MRKTIIHVALLIAVLAIPSGATAQLGVNVYGGYGTFGGDDFQDINGGYVVGAELLVSATSSFRLGAGGSYAYYGVEGDAEDIEQFDVSAVARYLFPSEGPRPYLGLRAGFSTQAAALNAEDVERSGTGIGPQAGVLVPLGSVRLDLGLEYIFQSFGDTEIDGSLQSGTETSGSLLVLRGGLAFGG